VTVAPRPEPAVPATTEPEPVPFDDYRVLALHEAYCGDQIRKWEAERAQARAEMAKILGDAEAATIAGKVVIHFEWINKMRTKELQKDHPDLYRIYTREVTKDEFDMDWFRRAQPELFRQYQTRVLRNELEAPGASAP
jgi:activator of HSP90 ATPase